MATTPSPSANQVPVKYTYTASGITFAKANENNIAIANTQSGIGDLTDVIAPVTLASGTITSTASSPNITGVGTSFLTDFQAGQYLFYYDYEGEPALLGKIASISTVSELIILVEDANDVVADVYCGMSSTILGTSESLMIQIPVAPNGPNIIIPNWAAYRAITGPLDAGTYNNSTFTNLEQYSNVNAPQNPATPPLLNIPFTIQPVYNFQSYETVVAGQKTTLYWLPSPATVFPSFCYAILNPYGDSETILSPNTLYKLFASESFNLNGIVATTAYSKQLLTLAGY